MYGLKVYITPEDIIDKLSDEDKERFNQCVFTNVVREVDGSITIECVVFDDPDPYVREKHRQRYCSRNLSVDAPKQESKIEVIQKGNLNCKERTTCNSCSSIVEFDASDISQTMDYDHVMNLEIWHSYVKCPVCNRYTKAREDLAFEA